MNWKRFESRLREQLRLFYEHHPHYDAEMILDRIDTIVGEETGRGFESDRKPKPPADHFQSCECDADTPRCKEPGCPGY